MSHSRLTLPPDSRRSFHIAASDEDDVAEIAPLFDAYRQFYGGVSDVSAACTFLRARLADRESVILIASEHTAGGSSQQSPRAKRGTVVGFAQLYPSFSSLSMAPISILNDLFVAPAWRRSCVATELVHAAAAYASSQGAVRLALATQHTNAPARRLYASLGFVPDHEFTHLSLALPHGDRVDRSRR